VVCRHCAKWNLVPFESRLESIDACERLFRDTPTRYSTDNIGLARVKEGLELRIGPAMRPEFAGWRYGERCDSAAGGASCLLPERWVSPQEATWRSEPSVAWDYWRVLESPRSWSAACSDSACV
jgi:hypothetical protein